MAKNRNKIKVNMKTQLSHEQLKQNLLLSENTTIEQKIALIDARSKKRLIRTIRRISKTLK